MLTRLLPVRGALGFTYTRTAVIVHWCGRLPPGMNANCNTPVLG